MILRIASFADLISYHGSFFVLLVVNGLVEHLVQFIKGKFIVNGMVVAISFVKFDLFFRIFNR